MAEFDTRLDFVPVHPRSSLRMRKAISTAVAVLLVSFSVAARAATPTEFYQSLLQRGILHLQAGDLTRATTELRIAAFGLVDAIDGYQTAQVHIAIAFDRMGNADAARDAATRVVTAERISPRYATLDLSAAIRTEFENAAARLLTGGQLAALRGASATQPAAVPPPAPAPVRNEPVRVPEPQPQAKQTTVVAEPQKSEPPAAREQSEERSSNPPARTQEPAGPSSDDANPAAKPDPPLQPAVQPVPKRDPSTNAEPKEVVVDRVTVETAPATKPPVAATPATTARVERPATEEPRRSDTEAAKPAAAASATAVTPTAATAHTSLPPAERLAEASKALDESRLADARAIYRALLTDASIGRADLIRAAEGLYRARDFSGTLGAFQRLGTLRGDEEPWRFYLAVALYETGDPEGARRELAVALPHIRMTPDVERYRAKIEGTNP